MTALLVAIALSVLGAPSSAPGSGAAAAQTAPAEWSPALRVAPGRSLLVEARYDRLETAGGRLDGSAAAVDWLRAGERGVTIVGLAHNDVADTRWLAARLGRVQRAGRSIFEADLRAGPGRRGDEDLTYLLASAIWTRELVADRLSVRLGAQRFELEPVGGSEGRLGLVYLPGRDSTIGLEVVRSVHGDLDTRLLIARFDRSHRWGGWFLGATSGRTALDRVGIVEPGTVLTSPDLEEALLGLRLDRLGVTVIASHLRSEAVRRTSITLLHRRSF